MNPIAALVDARRDDIAEVVTHMTGGLNFDQLRDLTRSFQDDIMEQEGDLNRLVDALKSQRQHASNEVEGTWQRIQMLELKIALHEAVLDGLMAIFQDQLEEIRVISENAQRQVAMTREIPGGRRMRSGRLT